MKKDENEDGDEEFMRKMRGNGEISNAPKLGPSREAVHHRHAGSVRLRAYRYKSVFLAIFSGIAKPKSPTSVYNFFITTD
jgi:hypothetical protein